MTDHPGSRGIRLLLTAVLAAGLVACGSQSAPTELPAVSITLAPPPSTSPPVTSPVTPPATPAATRTAAPTTTRAPVAPRATTVRTVAPPEAAGRSWSTAVTFYGSADNDPPGSLDIAHPTVHQEAGGTGTYADPITMASDPREIAVGTRIYYPPLQKYFVMEDDCAGCISEWDDSGASHIDLWTGDAESAGLTACEHALTPDGRVVVEVAPPPGRAVDTRPLYGSNGCLR